MILLDDFFRIGVSTGNPGSVRATLTINAAHRIFEGHFPGQPVVPGVCMMQMVKEVLEGAIRQPLQLRHADHAKFLTPIDPRQAETVELELDYGPTPEGHIKMTARLYNGAVTYFKYKAEFTPYAQ
jgi:3-hydroxyacyl-[acyl-carrier-protein] dehydratase